MEKTLKKFTYCFVDFDKTIYDCAQLEVKMWQIFNKYAVKHEDYSATYHAALKTRDPFLYDYTFEEQLEFLAKLGYKLPKEILVELYQILDCNYLFPQVQELLNNLKKISQKVVLLTAGDQGFQNYKIKICGVEKMVDEVAIVDGDKDKYLLSRQIKPETVLFINDSKRENLLIKETFPAITILAHTSKHVAELTQEGIICFATIEEMNNYVGKL